MELGYPSCKNTVCKVFYVQLHNISAVVLAHTYEPSMASRGGLQSWKGEYTVFLHNNYIYMYL